MRSAASCPSRFALLREKFFLSQERPAAERFLDILREKRLTLLAGPPLKQNCAHNRGTKKNDQETNEDQKIDHDEAPFPGTSPIIERIGLQSGLV